MCMRERASVAVHTVPAPAARKTATRFIELRRPLGDASSSADDPCLVLGGTLRQERSAAEAVIDSWQQDYFSPLLAASVRALMRQKEDVAVAGQERALALAWMTRELGRAASSRATK